MTVPVLHTVENDPELAELVGIALRDRAQRINFEPDVLLLIEAFLGRFVSYPSPHTLVAHVLWLAI